MSHAQDFLNEVWLFGLASGRDQLGVGGVLQVSASPANISQSRETIIEMIFYTSGGALNQVGDGFRGTEVGSMGIRIVSVISRHVEKGWMRRQGGLRQCHGGGRGRLNEVLPAL